MHLIILDKQFKPLAPVNALQSLIWNRRYREPGTFELHAGPDDFDGIREGVYVYRDDRDEFGIIYEANIERDKTGAKSCYAKGYFGEHFLNDRVIDRTKRLSGTPEEISRQLVTDFFISPSGDGSYDGRGLGSRMELGDLSGVAQDAVKWQATGSPVGEAMYEQEAAQGLSHRLKYDYKNDKLVFSVWKGQDRNAIFSDRYSNLTATSYHRDTTDAPNIVYVAGNGEGTSRKVYRLDLRKAGEAAREMYVDARDLQQDFTGDDGESYHYTDEDYEALLADRGRQKAAEHQAQERFEASVDARSNLVYREDYDLGDICLASIDGIELTKQITGIRETYEAGKEIIELTLGDYGPTSIQRAVTRQAQINKEAGPATANVGDLNKLTTTDKTGIVPAVNEIDKDVGDLSGLETEDKSSLVNAINEIKQGGGGGGGGEDARIGDMSKLTTQAKDTVVNAINELDKDVGSPSELRHYIKQFLGITDDTQLDYYSKSLVNAISLMLQKTGVITSLKTASKYNLVGAINEIYALAAPGGESDARPLILSTETSSSVSTATYTDIFSGYYKHHPIIAYRITDSDGITTEASSVLTPTSAKYMIRDNGDLQGVRAVTADSSGMLKKSPGKFIQGTITLELTLMGTLADGTAAELNLTMPCRLIPLWRDRATYISSEQAMIVQMIACALQPLNGQQAITVYKDYIGATDGFGRLAVPNYGRLDPVFGSLKLTGEDGKAQHADEILSVANFNPCNYWIDSHLNPISTTIGIAFQRVDGASYPAPEFKFAGWGKITSSGTSGSIGFVES